MTPASRQAFAGHLEVTLPWTALAPDNDNRAPHGEEAKERRRAFALSKEKARELLREACDGEPTEGPVRLTATFYFPDNRVRDHVNFAKALLDAAKGIVITDDRWQVLRDARFIACGIDADRPRCELVIESIPQ